jgi:hypothetical protein
MTSSRLASDRYATPEVYRFPGPIELTTGADCPACSKALSLSQPDVNTPDRLLGICEGCKRWYVIELPPEQGGTLVLSGH